MKLNISDWKSFSAADVFFLYNGSGITKEEIEDNPGSFPAVQSGADNNGCIGYISKDYCKTMNTPMWKNRALLLQGLVPLDLWHFSLMDVSWAIQQRFFY